MHRRGNRSYFLLASVVVLGLTLLMVDVEAQIRIAFESDRDWHVINNFSAFEIYVMDADGSNQRNLTHNPADVGLPHGRRTVNGSLLAPIEMIRIGTL